MIRNTFKILEHFLQDFKSLSGHFGTLEIKGLMLTEHITIHITQDIIYMFQVTNKNIRTRYEICSKLTIKTPLLLLTLNIFHTCSSVSILNFEQVNAG